MTERAVRDKLARLSVPSRPRLGRTGGGGLEYDCSALPDETRAAITVNTIQAAGSKALAVVDTPAVRSFVPVAAPAVPAAHTPSQAEKDLADARIRLVHLVHDLVPMHGLRGACTLLAARIITGEAGEEIRKTARQANQRARGSEVSARSLERWFGMHRDGGWTALLPTAPQVKAPEVADDVAAVLGLFHSRDHRFRKLSGAAQEVTRMLGRDFDEWPSLYHRARRVLDKVGQSAEASVALIKSRHTGAQRDAKLPFKRRDTSMLDFGDVFVIDGHTFKAKVRHPDHGAPFAPELTAVLDAATRLIVGWSVNLSENVIAVGDSLRHAVSQYGVPAILYGDNGAGETAKAMDCPIDGICARLGIDHRLGLPGKPQGHGIIERSWQTHAINAARKFGSYQGGDVDAGTFRKVAAVLAKEQRAVKRYAWELTSVGVETCKAALNASLFEGKGKPAVIKTNRVSAPTAAEKLAPRLWNLLRIRTVLTSVAAVEVLANAGENTVYLQAVISRLLRDWSQARPDAVEISKKRINGSLRYVLKLDIGPQSPVLAKPQKEAV